jgi:TetR/AcrR family transcriptional regulator
MTLTEKPKASSDQKRRNSPAPRKRNAAITRERILKAAMEEFCAKGFNGARMDRIVEDADCNIRMAYHYFGDKEGLYLTVLEGVYNQLRSRESELELKHMAPEEGVKTLVEFTFDYMANHPEFVSMISNENMMKGKFLHQSENVPKKTTPLVQAIRNLLKRGQVTGVFKPGVDPVQLYVSILSLSYVHISNRHTLSIIFSQDLDDPEWLNDRRKHAYEVIIGFLRP